MRLFPCDRYPLPLPDGHRFPIDKYMLLRRRLEQHAAAGMPLEFIEPHAATDDELQKRFDALSPDEQEKLLRELGQLQDSSEL